MSCRSTRLFWAVLLDGLLDRALGRIPKEVLEFPLRCQAPKAELTARAGAAEEFLHDCNLDLPLDGAR